MDDDPLLLHAKGIAFRETANDLQALLNKLVETDVISRKDIFKVIGYSLSITILRGLSAEFMLKGISKTQSGTYEYTHDLERLYEALGEDAKRLINATAISRRTESPDTVLRRHKDDFVGWRYSFDEEGTNLRDLDETIEILDFVFRQISNG